MKRSYFIILSFLLSGLLLWACSKKDEVTPTITAEDFAANLSENAGVGTVIGTISASTNQGELSFTIASQSVSGAVAVSDAGVLTVADAAAFDHETNPSIVGVITISNTKVSKDINFTITVTDESELSISNFTIAIDENPTNGQVIGTPTFSGGTPSFTLSNQSPVGALAINATTGELTVADATLFDYETRTSITATITASVGTVSQSATVTINLNDEDAILASLTTSKTAYENAKTGEWITVTATEYESLLTNLSNVSRVGLPENLMPSSSFLTFLTDATMASSGNAGLTIPRGSHVIAFKYRLTSTSATSGDNVKVSAGGVTGPYSQVGDELPSVSGSGYHYFVIKTNNRQSSTTSETYLAVYASGSIDGIVGGADIGYSSQFGDAGILSGSNTGQAPVYQGLTTTSKQW